VADNQFRGELVAATGEISCPSVGRNLAATGEDLMAADTGIRIPRPDRTPRPEGAHITLGGR